MALDFEKEFSSFVNASGGSAIKEIYSIIPSLNQKQMQIVHLLKFYIKKYDLKDLDEFLNSYLSSLKSNKNLNFLSSMNMKALLKSYTLEEMTKGIKIQSMNNQEGS